MNQQINELNQQIAEERASVAKAQAAVIDASDSLARNGSSDEGSRRQLRHAGIHLNECEAALRALEMGRDQVLATLKSSAHKDKLLARAAAAKTVANKHFVLADLARDVDNRMLELIASIETLATARKTAQAASAEYLALTNYNPHEASEKAIALIRLPAAQSHALAFGLKMCGDSSALQLNDYCSFNPFSLSAIQSTIEDATKANTDRIMALVNDIEEFHK